MQRIYAAIDLKSFYASVECRERGLDPMTTNLVVADESRTEKTICRAVSPSLKAFGVFMVLFVLLMFPCLFFYHKKNEQAPEEIEE